MNREQAENLRKQISRFEEMNLNSKEQILMAGIGVCQAQIALELDRIADLLEVATDPDRGIIDALRRIGTGIEMLEGK